MVLFWLFFVLVLSEAVLVLVLVLDRAIMRSCDRAIMRLYHSIPVNALLGWEFGNGLADGDKEHDPRVGERRLWAVTQVALMPCTRRVRLRARAPSAAAD